MHNIEQTKEQKRNHEAANFIIYINDKLDYYLVIPPYVIESSKNYFANDERLVPELCKIIKSLSKDEFEKIVYNAHNKQSRALADWWEEQLDLDEKKEMESIIQIVKDALDDLEDGRTIKDRKKMKYKKDYLDRIRVCFNGNNYIISVSKEVDKN